MYMKYAYKIHLMCLINTCVYKVTNKILAVFNVQKENDLPKVQLLLVLEVIAIRV